MHPDLARCLAMIEAAVAGLDDARAAERVDGRWSIAEIVEHLDRTYSGTAKGLERCLEANAARASARTVKSRLVTFYVVTLGRFPTGVEAPRHVVPTGTEVLSAVLPRVRHHLATFDAAATEAAARFGSGPILDHPILGPFSVRQWRRFHVVHTRHHQAQMIERRRRVEEGGAPALVV